VEDLQEVIMGDWAGGEGRRRRAAGDPHWLVFARSGRWDALPSGEGDASLRGRVVAAIDDAAAKHQGGTVAVVCHGGVINAYLAEKLGIERTFFVDVANTSVTVVHVGDGTFVPVVVADCHHLYDPALPRRR
jgi:broad specificity phosphatase PhoE